MNEKEISEIRRRFRPDRSGISHIRGCYVNENREIVSQFDQSLGLMSQEESEKLLAILRRTLSGTLGKNLADITFSTQQVVDSEEHRLLMALRGSSLADEEAVQALFQRVISSLTLEGNYLILLAHDTYDVPYRAKDGERMDDASDQVFSYILCSICPVKLTKPALSYFVYENAFHDLKADWVVSPPEAGFLFPAFDGRRTNLYNCLFYTHSSGADNQPLIDALFHVQPPMPADEQRDTFSGVLRNALDDECSLAVVQQVRQEIKDRIDAWQEAKSDDPLVVSGDELKDVLESCGVSEDKRMQFGAQFDESFGGGAVLNPRNLIDVKKCVVKTPDVSITVNPDRPDLIETRTLGGVRYILIKADEGVELNGIDLAEEA